MATTVQEKSGGLIKGSYPTNSTFTANIGLALHTVGTNTYTANMYSCGRVTKGTFAYNSGQSSTTFRLSNSSYSIFNSNGVGVKTGNANGWFGQTTDWKQVGTWGRTSSGDRTWSTYCDVWYFKGSSGSEVRCRAQLNYTVPAHTGGEKITISANPKLSSTWTVTCTQNGNEGLMDARGGRLFYVRTNNPNLTYTWTNGNTEGDFYGQYKSNLTSTKVTSSTFTLPAPKDIKGSGNYIRLMYQSGWQYGSETATWSAGKNLANTYVYATATIQPDPVVYNKIECYPAGSKKVGTVYCYPSDGKKHNVTQICAYPDGNKRVIASKPA